MAYKLRAITFSTQGLLSFFEGTTIDTEVLASNEKLDKPYIVVSGQFRDGKSTSFDIDNIDFVKMGLNDREAEKKLSLMPLTDDLGNSFPNMLMFAGDLSDFEINATRIVLTGIGEGQNPIVHVLEKI